MTSTDAPARTRRVLPALVLGAAGAWALVLIGHIALSGRVWWWAMVDLATTPVVVLAAPLLLGIVLVLARQRLSARVRWLAGTLAAVELVAAGLTGQSDLGVLAGCADAPADARTIRVTSWNTLFWSVDSDPAQFYDLMAEQGADLLVLQEYMGHVGTEPVPIDDSARLAERFPDMHVAVAGELLTLSRFPVLDTKVLAVDLEPATSWADYWRIKILRTDLDVDGTVLSVYNVHLADPIHIGVSPLDAEFYRAAHYLDGWKRAQLDLLRADLAANPHPVLLTGDVNFPPGSGEERALAPLADAACGEWLPVTFGFRGMWWWRLDRTFTSADVLVHDHSLPDPRGMSTHRLQNLVVSIKERP